MQVSLDISMYPLAEEYKPAIIQFIENLRLREELRVETNGFSTQLYGSYDSLMQVLQEEMRPIMMQEDKVMMVMKLINDDLSGPIGF